MIAITDVGFGVPHPSRTYSPGLQRVSPLEGDGGADCILFDDFDCPINFVIYESFMKLCSRTIRADTEWTGVDGRALSHKRLMYNTVVHS
jgi:hypothetical protein